MTGGDTFDHFAPERGRFGDDERPARRPHIEGKSNLVDVEVVLHHQTERAVRISDNGAAARAKWLPRSLIEIAHTGQVAAGKDHAGKHTQLSIVTLTLPEWLAKREGLL